MNRKLKMTIEQLDQIVTLKKDNEGLDIEQLVEAMGLTVKEEELRETLMDIQQKLKQFRFNQSLSLEEVAKETGVSKSTLARIETGDSNPTINTIQKINTGIAKWNIDRAVQEESK